MTNTQTNSEYYLLVGCVMGVVTCVVLPNGVEKWSFAIGETVSCDIMTYVRTTIFQSLVGGVTTNRHQKTSSEVVIRAIRYLLRYSQQEPVGRRSNRNFRKDEIHCSSLLCGSLQPSKHSISASF